MTAADRPDVLTEAEPFVQQCGPCDFGVTEVGCNCPPGDYRPVMSRLMEEVRRLRAELEAAGRDRDGLVETVGSLVSLPPERVAEAYNVTYGRPAASPGRPSSVRDTIAAAIRAVDSGIERGTRPIASAISAALSGIGMEWHPATINEVVSQVDGWDEIGAAELAHHVMVGLDQRAAGDAAGGA